MGGGPTGAALLGTKTAGCGGGACCCCGCCCSPCVPYAPCAAPGYWPPPLLRRIELAMSALRVQT